ncbi:hypothetical protein ACLOJK_035924 [Asimina triloba]
MIHRSPLTASTNRSLPPHQSLRESSTDARWPQYSADTIDQPPQSEKQESTRSGRGTHIRKKERLSKESSEEEKRADDEDCRKPQLDAGVRANAPTFAASHRRRSSSSLSLSLAAAAAPPPYIVSGIFLSILLAAEKGGRRIRHAEEEVRRVEMGSRSVRDRDFGDR